MLQTNSALVLMLVLIDTWWNVNLYASRLIIKMAMVLIDTWWNVNTLKSPDAKTDSTVLIDTWWNENGKRVISYI